MKKAMEPATRHWMQGAGIALLLLLVVGCGSSTSAKTQMAQPPDPPPPSQPPPTALQVGSVSIQPQNAALAPGQTMHFTAASTSGGAITWMVNGIVGGNSTIGIIDANGNYTAPPISQSINAVVYAALASSPQANYATAPVALIQSGQVLPTINPQVAVYAMYLPQPGSIAIRFSPGTGYGNPLNTWSQATPTTPANYGGEVNIEVAGMRASTTYNMQAVVTLANGVTFTDSTHTFTTGAAPQTAPVQITTPSGQTPQPGIELYDTMFFSTMPYSPNVVQAFATDLQGNVIWTYSHTGSADNVIFPIKLMPNGHFLVNLGITSGSPPGSPLPPGTIDDVQEVDLAGNIIHDLSMSTLNQSLAANGFTGINLFSFSHDILFLPNGHKVLLANMTQPFTNLPGYPGTTNVVGDVIVDVDQNYNPDWVWNSFDHPNQLSINRHPFQFPPDWTHSDAMLYSASDHNLLLSVRNQNWILKIDYQDATGTGNILWHLGYQGDFTLKGGTDPTDWFYAQHGINFFGPNTSGVFQLGMMDDGDDRQFPAGVTCGTAGAPPCHYSTVPELQIDETAMTATMISHYIAPASLYSFFGGQADLLPNGDIEADFASAVSGATVQEYQPGSSVVQTAPQIVWQSVSPGYDQYRALRIPSLYPGVQW